MDEHLKKIQSDVDAMNKVFDGKEVEVKTDPPSTDPPEVKTDPPSTDPPFEGATDAPKTDAPTTDEPKTDPPTTDVPDDRDKVIEELRKKLAEKDEVKTDPPATNIPTTAAPKDFVGELDLEEMTPKELNVILNKTYKQAVEDTRAQGGDVLQVLPELVAAVSALQQATETFYTENKDLTPYKAEVGKVFEKLRTDNPDKNYTDLIADVAPAVRKRLELPEPSNKTVDKGTPPRLPRKKSKPGKTKDELKVDPVSKGIDDMNKSLGR